jgi:uncharacterized protein
MSVMHYADFALVTLRQKLGVANDCLARAEAAGMGDETLGARLAEDMFPLAHQVLVLDWQVADMLSRCARIGIGVPHREDDPQSLAEARQRIADTLARLDGVAPEDFLSEDEAVEFELPMGLGFGMTAGEYVRDWAIPQFYFHLMALYAILRSQGLDLGKKDYVPYMWKYATKGMPVSEA